MIPSRFQSKSKSLNATCTYCISWPTCLWDLLQKNPSKEARFKRVRFLNGGRFWLLIPIVPRAWGCGVEGKGHGTWGQRRRVTWTKWIFTPGSVFLNGGVGQCWVGGYSIGLVLLPRLYPPNPPPPKEKHGRLFFLLILLFVLFWFGWLSAFFGWFCMVRW